MDNLGNLYVIAAPSGTGKTTLVHALINTLPNITVSISHTTRPKRPGEEEGRDYYFVEQSVFQNMIDVGDFLEHATIFEHFYGTSKTWVDQKLASGIDVILEIDWQGNQQIKRLFPNCISVFILPPSQQDLENRLKKRNQDKPHIIKMRIADAKETVTHISEFNYVVINDNFQHALNDLKVIVQAGRLLEHCQTKKYEKLVQDLTKTNN